MIAKQTVYTDSERKLVLVEGDPRVRFQVCRVGCEINEASLERYDGALALAMSEPTKSAAAASEAAIGANVGSREVQTQTRVAQPKTPKAKKAAPEKKEKKLL